MKTKIYLITVLSIITNHLTSQTMPTISWFSNKNFSSLEIQKHKSISENKIVSSILIDDSKVIESIVNQIEKIPTDGEMMISFGQKAEQIDLIFHNRDQTQKIQIFQKRFKTPSTGFHTVKSELEANLYNDIVVLLFTERKKTY